MIHEGTHGIQALDLLGRKVAMQHGAGLALLETKVAQTIGRAQAVPALAVHAAGLAAAVQHLSDAPLSAWSTGNRDEALANATPYLQAFGHVVLAWVWLDVALGAQAQVDRAGSQRALLRGKRAACICFFHYELPRIGARLKVVETRDATCRTTEESWFE